MLRNNNNRGNKPYELLPVVDEVSLDGPGGVHLRHPPLHRQRRRAKDKV